MVWMLDYPMVIGMEKPCVKEKNGSAKSNIRENNKFFVNTVK